MDLWLLLSGFLREGKHTVGVFAELGDQSKPLHCPSPSCSTDDPTLVELLSVPLQGLANMLWAFAKLGKPVPRLCSAAGAEVTRRLSAFSLRDLSQILWAFAKLEHRGSPAAVTIMADHTAAILRDDGEAAALCLECLLWRCLQTLDERQGADMLCPAVWGVSWHSLMGSSVCWDVVSGNTATLEQCPCSARELNG